MVIAVVIPAYNESKRIMTVVNSLPKTIGGHRVEPIVIDDGSTDQTALAAEQAGATVIRHVMNRGQGAALRTGFEYALAYPADIVVTFDADGQHSASEINALVKPIIRGEVPICLGSRFLRKGPQTIPLARLLILKTGVVFTFLLSNIRVTDTHNGFRAFHRSALERLTIIHDRMEHASEILDQISRHKLAFKEIPVTIHYSDYSLTKGQKNGNSLKIALKMIAYKLR